MSIYQSQICIRGAHWVCNRCSPNGTCPVHRSQLVKTHQLWASTLKINAICQLGCVAHTAGVCTRAQVGPIYQPNAQPFKTLAALQFAHSTTPAVAVVSGIALKICRDVAVVLLPGNNATAMLVVIHVHLPYHSHAQVCRTCVPARAEIGDELMLEWDPTVPTLCTSPTVAECAVSNTINYIPTLSVCEAKRSWRYTREIKHSRCSAGVVWPQSNLPEFENIMPLFQPELPCCHIRTNGVQCGWCNREYLTAEEYMQECAPHFEKWFE
jgi:hypothetical protein